MNRPTQIFTGAAVLAVAVTGVAFFLLRAPDHDPARLLAALDAFTGEWEGDASIQSSDGKPLQPLRVTRRYSWVGEKQIVETRFALGAAEQVKRSIQWIEDGRLHALETGPEDEAETYSGAPTPDGIFWTNLHRPKSDRLDRLVVEGDKPTVQSASITPLRLGDIADLVGVAAVLLPRHTGGSPGATASGPVPDAAEARVAALERKLAEVEQEREKLRMRLARAEAAATAASARTSTADHPPRPSQLEIRSSPPGMKFEIRAEDEKNVIAPIALSSGTTPVTLTAVPPGNYAVILERARQRKTVHHVTVNENVDVLVFHREDGSADGATTISAPPVRRESPAAPAPLARDSQ